MTHQYHGRRHGEWDWQRGYAYLHSTFCDLVITGLVGLRPRSDALLVINPLVPEGVEWFAIDNLLYHGINLSISWDQHGAKYGLGHGLHVWADGQLVAHSSSLQSLSMRLPMNASSSPVNSNYNIL